MPIIGPDGREYEMTVKASGEVRDKDGNLVEDVQFVSVVDDAQAARIMQQLEETAQ